MFTDATETKPPAAMPPFPQQEIDPRGESLWILLDRDREENGPSIHN